MLAAALHSVSDVNHGDRTKRWAVCLVIALVCCCAVSGTAAADLGLITAGANGTYHQFGLDLKRLVKRDGINLTVHPSKGSVDNIFAVYQRPAIQMGIVQSDVLAFVAALPSNPALTQIAQNTRMVFPLFSEEVHVLGRREIGDFQQLAGTRVAIGAEGSGTNLTARLLFKLAGIAPGEALQLEGGQALAQLKAGRIDAMVYVAGSPVKLFKDQVTAADGLALLPISNKTVLDAYGATEIPANVYDWQTTPVTTAAVRAVLISHAVRGPGCEQIGRFAYQVATGMDWLMKNGHPRWKQVELDRPLAGWEQYDCVRKHLARHPGQPSSRRTAASERNSVAESIKGILSEP